MRKLYEITDEMVAMLDTVDPETGELPPELDTITENFRLKAGNVVAYTLNLDAAKKQRDDLIKKLQAQNKADENRKTSLLNYLQHHMERTGITLIEANDGSFRARLYTERDSRVDIFDERQIPAGYLSEIPAKKRPDKRLIKLALDCGQDVPGARMVSKNRLEIR